MNNRTQDHHFQPSQEILDRYAQVLVNFALNKGQGIKKGEVVFLHVPEAAKPLLIFLNQAVLKAGGHPIIQYLPNEMAKDFFQLASEDQIKFYPACYLQGKVKQADHSITIIAETDKHELEGIDPKLIMERRKTFKPYHDLLDKKECRQKFSWTLALYGTKAMAEEAGLTLKEGWDQIIKACYLDDPQPIKKWQEIQKEIMRLKNALNKLEIQKIHVQSKKIDLIVGIGTGRQWRGGEGNNIPSFEIFTSPDARITEGKIAFDLPLYRYGNLIKDIEITFKKGKITHLQAKKGEKVLEEMIKVKNANRIGEFSLTDKRISRIDKFMAETLYDENFGGKYGNVHLALGASYKDTYPGEIEKIKKNQWQKLGYNDSVIHTDLISTEDREVTAILPKGEKKVIYKEGRFTI